MVSCTYFEGDNNKAVTSSGEVGGVTLALGVEIKSVPYYTFPIKNCKSNKQNVVFSLLWSVYRLGTLLSTLLLV